MNYRYSRQIAVPEIGKDGQKKIFDAKVLIIGCGALGSMVAMQLAGAGIGAIGIADFDNVDVSNLHRQFFFTTSDAGHSKAIIIGKRIKALNPEVELSIYKEIITFAKAEIIIDAYDYIVDATDNPESKRIIGEISLKKGKPCCIGGVRDFSGQVIILHPSDFRFEDYFGLASSEGFLPCSMGGVVGPAAALCASLQAAEVLKYIIGADKNSVGYLQTFNLLTNTFRNYSL